MFGNRPTNPARRLFLRRAAVSGGYAIVTAATLQALSACAASARKRPHHPNPRAHPRQVVPGSYGGLTPVADQHGDEILALPKGFSYLTFGAIGDPMADGGITPCNLDGMSAFPRRDGKIRLIRNHEVRSSPGDRTLAVEGSESARYDPLGVGGTVSIDFDPCSLDDPRRFAPLVRDFVSLNGTVANCAGGYAFRDIGWITCEETTEGPSNGWQQRHGYAYLVPAQAESTVFANPIREMGRFSHEAAVADPVTGIIYQTEDAHLRGGSGFYRYIPKNPANLQSGGRLQMIGVRDRSRANLREGQTVGQSLPVEWMTIDVPDSDLENGEPSVFDQGFAKGGAMFNRLEGIFRGEQGEIYFASTRGGDAKKGEVNPDGYAEGYGQIWCYRPGTDQDELVLVFESPGGSVLDSPDNICITPGGGILICEDGVPSHDDTHPLAPGVARVNRLIGLTRGGEAFEFAVNRLNSSEFAGCCFDPTGSILFVNIYGNGRPGSGMTCAITGPWEQGPL